jgi:hypothetical protein
MFDLYFRIPSKGPQVLIGIFGVRRKSNSFIETETKKCKEEEEDERIEIVRKKKEMYIEEEVVLREE